MDYRASLLPLSSAQQSSVPANSPSMQLRIRSEDLLRGCRELVIEHHGAEYRLLRTRNDRLILNK